MAHLPIHDFRDEIVATVKENSVVVITAETGAGKSTQVPQFLLQEGWDCIVTQPRRLAARTVAARVAYEVKEELGGTIGFRTAMERKDSRATRVLFCTDGLALVRELMGAGTHDILVIDEVHEWNLNIETLAAWANFQLKQGAQFKVVLMSATLEADRLAAYFGGAPVIRVPGRLHPITERRPGNSVASDAAQLISEGRNVLVFQPGKREIEETISALSSVGAEVFPLHGELNPEEQQRCFRNYSRPKCVVATNVAQTSVTIDDIDAVVDSGMEKRIECVDGVEGLYLKPISLADREQRKGRAGRTKPGIFIDHCKASERPEFPKAEVLRSRLDQTVLRLAEAGFDMEELDFFHQPDKGEIHEAKRALKALGCMDAKGAVTSTGRRVAKLPISVEFGRMVVEAERLGVVDDIITAAAILENGEITVKPRKYEESPWRKLVADERESDIMAQLKLYQLAGAMKKEEMRDKGIHVGAYYRTVEVRRHLADSLRGKVREFKSSGDRVAIVKAVCAGMVDHLYAREYAGRYRNGGGERELARESVVTDGAWIVGLPFDLEIEGRRGRKMTLRLVRMVTKVDPAWLVEIAPQLVETKTELSPAYDSEKDSVTSVTELYFNGQKVRESRVADPEHAQATTVFCQWLARQMAV